MSETDGPTRLVEVARADLAERLDVDAESIRVSRFSAVTWRDGSLGCPAPDGLYTQALVKGYRLVLSVDATDYYYHAGAAGEPFLCPEERRRDPLKPDSARL